MAKKKIETLPEEQNPEALTPEILEETLEITLEETIDVVSDSQPAPISEPEPEAPPAEPEQPPEPIQEKPPRKPAAPRKKPTIMGLNLRELDRDLSAEQRQEWEAIYASYRSKSILSGTVVGVDETSFEVRNQETGAVKRKAMNSLILISYRVKVLVPESELWANGEERPAHVLRNMVGSIVDYVILEVDREGECAIASRRLAIADKRRHFGKSEHREGDLLQCRVLSVGAKRCTAECHGFDVTLSQRDLSYSAIPDLRQKYRPGQIGRASCRERV